MLDLGPRYKRYPSGRYGVGITELMMQNGTSGNTMIGNADWFHALLGDTREYMCGFISHACGRPSQAYRPVAHGPSFGEGHHDRRGWP